MRIKIKWQLSHDQYQSYDMETIVDIEDKEWNLMSDQERQDFINDSVEEDFNNRVGYDVDDYTCEESL